MNDFHLPQTIDSGHLSTSRKMWLEFVASRVTFDVLDCVELLGIALFISSRKRIFFDESRAAIHFSMRNASHLDDSSGVASKTLTATFGVESQAGLQAIILVFASLSLLTPAVAIADLSFSLHGSIIV